MAEHPILFSTEMVKVILKGNKTQTRRIFKDTTEHHSPYNPAYLERWKNDSGWENICPYGKIGDTLWVRETFAYRIDVDIDKEREKAKHYLMYKANGGSPYNHMNWHSYTNWKPSIHMPRWASRINLKITDIRIQKLQDVSENDAFEEGMNKQIATYLGISTPESQEEFNFTACRRVFHALWDYINAKRGYSWESNPWVWCISFRKIDKPIEVK